MTRCDNPHCEKCNYVFILEKELRAVYRLLEERRQDLTRCPHCPGGERCALPAGHEGSHKWAGGD